MSNPKPKVLISTSYYRLVSRFGYSIVEIKDGRDRMGVQRWKDWSLGDASNYGANFRHFLNSIAGAIELRAKRRRKSR